jgi:hypothetical protein
MPEIATDSPDSSCSYLHSEYGIHLYQSLGIDPSLPRAREGRGRFADGQTWTSAALPLLTHLKNAG